jgi:hypothetical protein
MFIWLFLFDLRLFCCFLCSACGGQFALFSPAFSGD